MLIQKKYKSYSFFLKYTLCTLCCFTAYSYYAASQPPATSSRNSRGFKEFRFAASIPTTRSPDSAAHTATSRPSTKGKPIQTWRSSASSLNSARMQTLYPSRVPSFSAVFVRAFSLYRKNDDQKSVKKTPLKETRFDASGLGLTIEKDFLVTVNDKLQRLAYFTIPLPLSSKVAFSLGPPLEPSPFRGQEFPLFVQPTYQGTSELRGDLDTIFQTRHNLDIEGIASCNGRFLLIAEQQRQIFQIDPKKKRWTRHPIPITAYAMRSVRERRPLSGFSFSANAGYEGIACDEKHQRLYLIQERQPRVIFVAKLPKHWVSMQPIQIIDHFDIFSHDLPRYQDGKEIPPDLAGAHVDQGVLYLLSRNEYTVLKVDPQKKQLLGRVVYSHLESLLYDTHEPYGLAEGLVVHRDRIWLIFDNNGRPRKGRSADRAPLLLELQRPLGF